LQTFYKLQKNYKKSKLQAVSNVKCNIFQLSIVIK